VDISDFYNQIYHHTVENQLNESGLPNQATKWIMRLLEATTAKVSRGIPIGPHATHLLAEATLIPIDNSLTARGYTFRRYVDDIVLFFNSEADARAAIYTIAEVLDKQQRLHLQNSKTQILESPDFIKHSEEMIADRPINDLEENIIGLINKYAHGDPYQLVFVSQLTAEDLRAFKPDTIAAIVASYLAADEPDFVRLRWFIRRLAQVGHPAAVQTCVLNIERLTPALSDICHYFIAVSMQKQVVDWPQVGEKLLDVLINNSVIASNEYFQLSIVALFSREPELNHVDQLIKWYSTAPPTLRREILLAASAGDAIDWVRERKEDVASMDPWTRRAFVIAAKKLPREERQFFLRTIDPTTLSEQWTVDWAKRI
jgi:hypothetical protein